MPEDDLKLTQEDRGLLHQTFAKPLPEIAVRYTHKIAENIQRTVHKLMETHIDSAPRITPISAHIASFHYGNRIAQEVMHILSIYFGYAHSKHPLARRCEFLVFPPEKPINKWEVVLIIDLSGVHNKLKLERLLQKNEQIKERRKKHKAYLSSLN